jgi:NADPH:quinone reductase-like Zn-dependent oxidoreductase
MKAVLRERYGGPDVLELRELETPEPADDEVLVRVRAASVNRADWYSLTGLPYVGRAMLGLRRPKDVRQGVDFAGTVEAVGAGVTRFRPGDEVFGGRDGAFAEYVCVRESRAIVPKPANVTFEQAAAVPIAGVTALQALRDKGGLQPGQRVLVNGASGGVGTFTVQIAKALGAEVTGVCSPGNVELVRSLGADNVVDYTREDFTHDDRRYDLMVDVAGSRSWRECVRVLEPDATYVLAGGPLATGLLGPLGGMAAKRLASIRSGRTFVFFIAKLNQPDLELLGALLEDGRLMPALDGEYELADVAGALRYMGEGHARAKVVVRVGGGS